MINPYEQKFRVLRILKGTGPLLKCKLSVVPLADETAKGSAKAPYEAISYRWRLSEGLPEFPVLINGHTFHVQPNVYRLLRDVRLHDKDRCIWIDSICINQNYKADSDMQIPLMYQIYSQAKQVISWFADSREGMGGITALKHVIRNGLPNDSDLWYIIHAPFSFQLVAWMKIVEFLRHDYFMRMWMIQEVALSRKLTMIKGEEELDWSEFATILPHLDGPQGERFLREPNSFGRWYLDSRVSHGIKGALSMHAARELLTRESLDAMDLLMLPKQLQLVQNRINTPLSGDGRRLRRLPLSAYGVLAQLLSLPEVQSTVPEDKIYGISGLLERSAQQPVVYGQDASSTSTLLRDFASKLLRHQERTFPPYLSLAGWGYKELASPISSPKWKNKEPQNLKFPSWVPDIYQPRTGNPAIDGIYLSGTAEPKRVSKVPESDELLKISMSRVIGTIASITTSAFGFPDPPDPRVLLNNIRTFITEARKMTASLRQSRYPYPRDAFTRTIFGDILAAASPLPPIPAHMVGALEQELDVLVRNPNVANAPHGILFELGRSLRQHRFCVLSSGHFGLVPLGCKTGDGVVIVWGAQTPFALRRASVEEKVAVEKLPDGLQDQWVLLGSCYLHGFMDEQATRAVWGDRDVVVR
ncbi:Heterokaryon incompatibility protein (HET) domain containing protein [Rhypophila decipiens]